MPARPHLGQPTNHGYWQHRGDESRCPVYLTNRARPHEGVGGWWWCTDHQQYVEWVATAPPKAVPARVAEVEQLRALSEAATAGEWTVERNEVGGPPGWVAKCYETPDATFIAAAVNHVRAALAAQSTKGEHRG